MLDRHGTEILVPIRTPRSRGGNKKDRKREKKKDEKGGKGTKEKKKETVGRRSVSAI